MSFPSSPNEARSINMSPMPNSVSPNRNDEFISNSSNNAIMMPPPVDDTNVEGIDLLANPRMTSSVDNSPIGSPKMINNEPNDYQQDFNNNNIPEFENNNYENENNDENDDVLDDFYPTRPNQGMSPEEMLNRKQEILFQFDKLQRRGLTLPRKYTLRDDLDFLEFEYEKIKKQRETESSIQFSRKMLMACITGVEYLNGKFDPFDVNLDGWSESVMENINDYDEVFEELHDKYKSKVKVAPEIRLMLMLGGSAFMFHLTNTMLRSGMPNMGDMFKNNPDLMKGMANMMGGMMQQQQPPMMPPMMMGKGMMPQQNLTNSMPPGLSQGNEVPPSPEINQDEVRRVNLGQNDRKEMKGPASLDALLGTDGSEGLASVQRKRSNNRGRKMKSNEISIS